MSTFDIVILCLLVAGFIMGYKRGLIKQAIHMVGFIVAIIVAFLFNGTVAEMLQGVIPYPFSEPEGAASLLLILDLERMFYKALAFALLFFGTKLVLSLIGHLLTAVASLPGLNLINRWLGGTLGVLQIFVLMFIVVHVLFFIPWETGHQWLASSSIAQWMTDQTSIVPDQIMDIWNEAE
ncbi:CvpA family protein [Bacillus horti]|uniref:Membrane protein required for colicin V production n=1 Tax=Caldalkalibacillus horti TaxID=77523 RepID=A0ABT9VX55_9BACI|nr:CvpA family protein [Bacillus horti]MDQ0165392.1 putative membrane protein required for colicin V production [Bacillus horti]